MTPADDAVRLRHMLDAARKAVAFTRGRSRADLDADELLALALVRLLEVLGEAAKGVSSEFRGRHPQVPWKDVAGTRDRLIHGFSRSVDQLVGLDTMPERMRFAFSVFEAPLL